jgi:hypothetical protein
MNSNKKMEIEEEKFFLIEVHSPSLSVIEEVNQDENIYYFLEVVTITRTHLQSMWFPVTSSFYNFVRIILLVGR